MNQNNLVSEVKRLAEVVDRINEVNRRKDAFVNSLALGILLACAGLAIVRFM